ncbi:hypothetical protein COT68_00515 [bacterium (Candidatus Torokbacteria) CG09_land_8_20_14_0_10_42_11]|nr:MAG: hypothetical protein COT68_00515 [bacterium (Candidatus Torokbacteria) CG09_land_8_20_14_0_10_42_11]
MTHQHQFTVALGAKIQKGPFGGGNQFAINLKNFLEKRDVRVLDHLDDPGIDLILVSETRPDLAICAFDLIAACQYAARRPKTIIVLRVNECDERKNNKIKLLNQLLLSSADIADHTIFISHYLQNLFLARRPALAQKSTIILNGANQNIFHSQGQKIWDGQEPLRLVTHHWGTHWNKGFDIYLYLDKLCGGKLKNKAEFTFIGNLARGVKFENTKVIPPQTGKALAASLSENHIYLTASVNEPAGMHHIEGGLCGLPILYRQSGALPEYCQGFGIAFRGRDDFLAKLYNLRQNYQPYLRKMPNYLHTAEKMGVEYYHLFLNLLKNKKRQKLKNKNFTLYKILQKILFLKEKCSLHI